MSLLLTGKASELAERASDPAGRSSEPSGMSFEPPGWVSEPPGNLKVFWKSLEPSDRAWESARRALELEPDGRTNGPT